jgi:hypothetical protein
MTKHVKAAMNRCNNAVSAGKPLTQQTLLLQYLTYPPEKHIGAAARLVLSVCPMSLCPASTP